MRHVYFFLLTILYACSLVTYVQAAHLRALGLRALHTSAVLSAWGYKEFPKDNPYLFILTHNCAEKNQAVITRFQYAARSFNEGKGVLLAASSYQETSQKEIKPYIARDLLQFIDLNLLKKLIEREENDIWYSNPVVAVTDTLCADVKLLNTGISRPVKGVVVAAFRHLKKTSKKEYEDTMFMYPIVCDNENRIMIQSIGNGEEEDYNFIGKIDYFKGYSANGLLVTTEGCRIEPDVIQNFRSSLRCELGVGQNGYRHSIQDFAKKHIPDDKDARLIILDRYELRKSLQGSNLID